MKLKIGENYYVRGVDYWVGRLVSIEGPNKVTLADAAWVSYTGRLHLFLRDGSAPGMEVEPVGEIETFYNAILPWPHKLFSDPV